MHMNSMHAIPLRLLLSALVALVSGAPVPAHADTYVDFNRAVATDDVRTVSKLLERGMDPNTVNENGEPALLDFGIAKLIDDDDEEHGTALTRMTGRGYTLGYCAPEQITGEPTGVAADVFSIGVLLFELLSGELPFKPEHEGRTALEHAIVHTDARVVGRVLDHPDQQAGMTRPRDAHHARGDLEAIVGKSLRRKPADRYSTIGALTADLEAWLARKPISIRAEDRRYRSRLWLRRNWLPASLGAVASVALPWCSPSPWPLASVWVPWPWPSPSAALVLPP